MHIHSVNSSSLSADQRSELLLQETGVISTRACLLTFPHLELEFLYLLRPVFQYGVALSLMLDGVVSPEEEYNGNYT
jgi:hypothetical protein